jgi:hypothetical protein
VFSEIGCLFEPGMTVCTGASIKGEVCSKMMYWR